MKDINYWILSPIPSCLWGSRVATANSLLDFQTLWSPQLLWSGPLLLNLARISLRKSQARLLSCCLVPVWDRPIYMTTVCFPGGLTGKGASYVTCCNPDAIALLAECRVFCQHAVYGHGRIRAQDFWFWQKQHIPHFIAGYSFLCYQYRTFFSSLVLLLHLVLTYTHFYSYFIHTYLCTFITSLSKDT